MYLLVEDCRRTLQKGYQLLGLLLVRLLVNRLGRRLRQVLRLDFAADESPVYRGCGHTAHHGSRILLQEVGSIVPVGL